MPHKEFQPAENNLKLMRPKKGHSSHVWKKENEQKRREKKRRDLAARYELDVTLLAPLIIKPFQP